MESLETITEDRNEKFVRAPRILGNTITGVGMGIATTIYPSFPFFLKLMLLGGYNAINPSESKSVGRHLAELAAYTPYAFAVSYASNELIQLASSLIDKF